MSADSPTTLLLTPEPSAMIRPLPLGFSSKPFHNVTLHECHRRDQRAQAHLRENPRVGPGRLGHECSSDWCCAETRGGAVTAASGPTLLRSAGVRSPMQ